MPYWMMADAVNPAVIGVSSLVPEMLFRVGSVVVASVIFDGIVVKLDVLAAP